jgi:ABC-type Fe3+/spermidine/putrescine transport system ATPase subunit
MRIRFEGVTQRYDGQALFTGPRPRDPVGKFFTLLGPRAAARPRCLRMLAGFVVPDAGASGSAIATSRSSRCTSAASDVVPGLALFPTAPRSPTVMYGWMRVASRRRKAKSRAQAMLDRVGLGNLGGSLSGDAPQRPTPARRHGASAGERAAVCLLLDDRLAAWT